MNEYVVYAEDGTQYVIIGESADSAVRNGMKYISRLLGNGCTVKSWRVKQLSGITYEIVMKYYPDVLCHIRRRKSPTPVLTKQFRMDYMGRHLRCGQR